MIVGVFVGEGVSVLVGVAVVILGFALRFNPLLVVVMAALVIPAVAVAVALAVKAPGVDWRAILEVKQASIVALTAGALIAPTLNVSGGLSMW